VSTSRPVRRVDHAEKKLFYHDGSYTHPTLKLLLQCFTVSPFRGDLYGTGTHFYNFIYQKILTHLFGQIIAAAPVGNYI
jgi:hypothetical protein